MGAHSVLTLHGGAGTRLILQALIIQWHALVDPYLDIGRFSSAIFFVLSGFVSNLSFQITTAEPNNTHRSKISRLAFSSIAFFLNYLFYVMRRWTPLMVMILFFIPFYTMFPAPPWWPKYTYYDPFFWTWGFRTDTVDTLKPYYYNDTLWFISNLLLYYLLAYPVNAVLGKLHVLLVIPLFAIVSFLDLRLLFTFEKAPFPKDVLQYMAPSSHIWEFFVGIFAAELTKRANKLPVRIIPEFKGVQVRTTHNNASRLAAEVTLWAVVIYSLLLLTTSGNSRLTPSGHDVRHLANLPWAIGFMILTTQAGSKTLFCKLLSSRWMKRMGGEGVPLLAYLLHWNLGVLISGQRKIVSYRAAVCFLVPLIVLVGVTDQYLYRPIMLTTRMFLGQSSLRKSITWLESKINTKRLDPKIKEGHRPAAVW